MTNEEIKTTFLGQTVSQYDGWNSSSEMFLVTDVKIDGSTMSLYGERANRNYTPCIHFHRDIVEHLVLDGKYVSHQEIDHCLYDVIIQIHPTLDKQFEQRIESIKAGIKRLKQELKQAQTDYQNFLVSSVRIEVMRKSIESNRNK